MMSRLSKGVLGRFARDRRGVSAVEFAMVAPIMIAFYFGLAEFCQGYMAQKRMGHSAAMVADLVSQAELVNRDGLDDILGVGDLIMKPFSAEPLDQRVSSITRDASGVARVDWSHVQTPPPPPPESDPPVEAEEEAPARMQPREVGEEVTIPPDLIANGESLILSEATFDYASPVDYVMPPVTQFSQTHYLRPRRVERVVCEDCPD